MVSSESSLGPARLAGTLSTIGRRLHWSLLTKNDVNGLRKVILAELAAVNVLLGIQQLSAPFFFLSSHESYFLTPQTALH